MFDSNFAIDEAVLQRTILKLVKSNPIAVLKEDVVFCFLDGYLRRFVLLDNRGSFNYNGGKFYYRALPRNEQFIIIHRNERFEYTLGSVNELAVEYGILCRDYYFLYLESQEEQPLMTKRLKDIWVTIQTATYRILTDLYTRDRIWWDINITDYGGNNFYIKLNKYFLLHKSDRRTRDFYRRRIKEATNLPLVPF